MSQAGSRVTASSKAKAEKHKKRTEMMKMSKKQRKASVDVSNTRGWSLFLLSWYRN